MFRAILALVLAASAIWSIYWFVGQRSYRESMVALAFSARDSGWDVDFSDLKIRGYPNRFDATVQDLVIGNPANGDQWKAPFFQLLALSYDPRHVIAVWAEQQELVLAGRRYTANTDGLRASLETSGPDSEIERLVIEADGISAAGFPVRFNNLLAAIQQRDRDGNIYDLTLSIELASTGGASPLPAGAVGLELRALVEFDRPLSALACHDPGVRTVKLGIDRFALSSEEKLLFDMTAELGFDAGGYATGPISIRFDRIGEALALLDRLPGISVPERLLASVHAASPEGRLELDMQVRGGKASLLGIPLLDIPPMQPCLRN